MISPQRRLLAARSPRGGLMNVDKRPLAQTVDSSALLRTLRAFKKGDFSVRLRQRYTGVAGEIVDTLNEIIDLSAGMSGEFDRISKAVGKEGKLAQRAAL